MDPTTIEQAFRLTYSVASPADRTAIREAYMNWRADLTAPVSGSVLPNRARHAVAGHGRGRVGGVVDAVGCGCRAGGARVGAMVLVGVIEVTTAQVLAEAEAKLGRPLTSEERAAAIGAAERAQAGESEESTIAWLLKNYTPQGYAYQIGVEAGNRIRATMDSAMESVYAEGKAAAAAAAEAAERQLRESREAMERQIRESRDAAFKLGVGVLAVAALGVVVYGSSRRTAAT